MKQIVEEIALTSAKDLLEAIYPLNQRWVDAGGIENWCFRGQRDASWPLTPSAMRTKEKQIGSLFGAKDKAAQEQAERDAVYKFSRQAIRAGLPIPEDGQILRDGAVFRRLSQPDVWSDDKVHAPRGSSAFRKSGCVFEPSSSAASPG